MWSKKYEKCVVCGTIESRYASKGLCDKCNKKRLYKKNPEKIREQRRQWRKTHFENCRLSGKKYREKYSKERKMRQKEYREKNKEIIHQKLRKYYRENPEKFKIYRERRKLWRKANPLESRKSVMERLYGINPSAYKQILEKQEGKCAICGCYNLSAKKVFSIDHCHKTGKVRGLLCSNCNTALGLFKDKASNLLAAANYLLTNQ